ncbi:PfkB family carbohydrate kinase [Streptomyces sp. NPDC001691]|uniref:PfkB family carbohydrate kinase n=1 Tax=Streptomyces sp. NPDC001691 TaxID=3364600 RepID=UPI00369705E2
MDRLAVIGNISRDRSRYPDGRSSDQIGGAALNIALAAARTGVRAAAVSVIGHDLACLPTRLTIPGLDWSALSITTGTSATFTLAYDQRSQLVGMETDYGISTALTDHALAHIAQHPGDRYHVCCRRPLDVPRILQALTAREARFSADFFLPSADYMIRAAAPWLRRADMVFVNAEEYRLLARPLTEATNTDAGRHVLADTAAALPGVVITDGPHPVRLLRHGRQVTSVYPPRVAAVEVTGAGDTLAGTFLARVLLGDGDTAALKAAARAASRHTTAQRL